MKEAFEKTIKPLNDQLGQMLGITQVPVEDLGVEQTVKVKRHITVIKPNGNKIKVTPEQLRDLESLGLSVRRVA